MMSVGGKPRGVYVVTDAQLESAVGGTFVVQPGPAIPVAGFPTTSNRGISGGKPMAVYVVDDAEVARRGLMGGKPIPAVDLTSIGRGVDGPHIAIPVYVVSGSEYIGDGGVTPVPPTPPTPLVYYNHWMGTAGNDFDVYPDWTRITGTADNLRAAFGGSSYPQNLGADALIIWSDPPVPITSNDHWTSVIISDNSWLGGSTTLIGPCVRCRTVPGENNCYMFSIWQDGWFLYKYTLGVKQELASSAAKTPVEGEEYRIEAQGTTITCLINDVQVAQVTDSSHPVGTCGIGGDGIDANYEIWGIKCGTLPVGNARKFNNKYSGYQDSRYEYDACNAQIKSSSMDTSLTIPGEHDVNEAHWVEFDFEEPITAYGIATWNNGVDQGVCSWTDFEVYGKLEIGDSWTLIEAGMATDNPGGSGYWKSASFAAGESDPYRYWRAVINSTANVNNHITVYEIIMLGRTVV
jgi:hypothetical protein